MKRDGEKFAEFIFGGFEEEKERREKKWIEIVS